MKFSSVVCIAFILITGCQPNSLKEDPIRIEAIVGSETEIDLVNELKAASEITGMNEVPIYGGGSKAGIEQFVNGNALMVNSSVKMSSTERALLQENGFSGLVEVIFANDAIAVITNSKIGVDSLSVFQLKKIFNGQYINWKEVGGPDKLIQPFRRNDASGTNDFFWKKVVQGNYAPTVHEVKDNGDMLVQIEDNINGIGFISIGTIRDVNGKPSDKVWAVNIYIEGGEPKSPYSFVDVVFGGYYLARPLYQYFLQEKESLLTDFIDFELSEMGQEIVVEKGFFPVTETQSVVNQKAISNMKTGEMKK